MRVRGKEKKREKHLMSWAEGIISKCDDLGFHDDRGYSGQTPVKPWKRAPAATRRGACTWTGRELRVTRCRDEACRNAPNVLGTCTCTGR